MFKRNRVMKYVDSFGVEHAGKVEAESLFEAVVRGLYRLDSPHLDSNGCTLGNVAASSKAFRERPCQRSSQIQSIVSALKWATPLRAPRKRPLIGSSKTPSVILFLSKHGIS